MTSLLKILRYPDPRLRTVARPVEHINARIQALADDMLHTMYAAGGVGLAATQVNVHERVIVMDISPTRDQPRVLINPELVECSEDRVVGNEACLSVPQIVDQVTRHARVKVRALDRDGRWQEFDASGLEAVCVQHEMDHLMGKVFVEYLSPLRRQRIQEKLAKLSRRATPPVSRHVAGR